MDIRSSWPKWVVGGALAGVAVAAVCWRWGSSLAPVIAAPAAQAPAQPPQAAPAIPAPSPEYTQWVVAYIHGTVPITREMLGEYLIARMGADKLDALINLKVIEHECKERGLSVSAADVENAYRADLQGMKVTRREFEGQFLKQRRLTPQEYKDVLRKNLLLTKLCQSRVQVTDDDVRKAYEARFGERVECQIIYWSKEKEADARAAYERIRANPQVFDSEARMQEIPNFAAVAGRLPPFGRNSGESAELENAAFGLKPGDISPLVTGKLGGLLVVRCLARFPAQNEPLEKVRDALTREVREKKAQDEMRKIIPEFQTRAAPKKILTGEQNPNQLSPEIQLVSAQVPAQNAPANTAAKPSSDYSERVVAYIYDRVPITREMLGEYLITRFGTQRLDALLHKMVIEYTCRQRGFDVTPAEVEAALQQALHEQQMTLEEFKDRIRQEHRATLYEWKEDVIRPRLLMNKLFQGQVRASEEEIRMAYEAHYGEKVACQMILWPREEEKRVMMMYAKLRDDPQEFERVAGTQASPGLAKAQGRIADMGRHTTGNRELEKVAFGLKPGEVSHVMGVPEGLVVIKCLGRVPPQGKPLEEVRAALEREVVEKKMVLEIPKLGKELYQAANPVRILKDLEDTAQVIRDVRQEIEAGLKKDGK